MIKVLSHQLLQAASQSDDGHITIDDFLNTLRNISIVRSRSLAFSRSPCRHAQHTTPPVFFVLWEQALQDFSLNLPRQLGQPIADAKSLESVRTMSSSALRGALRLVTHGRNWVQVPLAKGDKAELARLRIENTALLAVLATSQQTRVVQCARVCRVCRVWLNHLTPPPSVRCSAKNSWSGPCSR